MQEQDKTVRTMPDAPEQRADMAPRPVPQAPITPESMDVTRTRDQDGNPTRQFTSAGRAIHNEITYRGVDWLMNSASGAAFATWTHRTETGRKWVSQPVEKFFMNALKPIFKKPGALKSGAVWGSTFISIMFGGTVTIPPLMALENHKVKRSIIKSLDESIYGKETVQNDPKFAKSYDEISREPKKDFSTGMLARIFALAPLLAITMYQPTHKILKKNFYDHIATGTKFVGEKMGFGKSEFMRRVEEHGNDGVAISNWDYVHRTIGFDFGISILYSFIHEITYKMFAKRKDDKHHYQEDIAEVKELRAEGKLPPRDEQADITLPGPTGPKPEPKPPEKPLPQVSGMQHISALQSAGAEQAVSG